MPPASPPHLSPGLRGESALSARPSTNRSGWLLKKGHAQRKWRKRYFVLRNDELFYYETDKSTEVKGKIGLRGATVERMVTAKRLHSFAVHTDQASKSKDKGVGGGRTFWLEGLTKESTDQWIRILKSAQGETVDEEADENVKFLDQMSHSGYLEKKGDRRRLYKRRYFVLVDAFLYYYESHQSGDAKGRIPLLDASIEEVSSTKREHGFQIKSTVTAYRAINANDETGGRTYYLSAESEADKVTWVTRLKTHMLMYAKEGDAGFLQRSAAIQRQAELQEQQTMAVNVEEQWEELVGDDGAVVYFNAVSEEYVKEKPAGYDARAALALPPGSPAARRGISMLPAQSSAVEDEDGDDKWETRGRLERSMTGQPMALPPNCQQPPRETLPEQPALVQYDVREMAFGKDAFQPVIWSPSDVAKYSFDAYGQTRFLGGKKGVFSKAQSVDEMLQWSKTLKKPLHVCITDADDLKMFNQFFKNITGFMKDRKSSKNEVGHGVKLLNLGVALAHLRDEIYCLLVRQLRNNPKRESVLLGWKLMALAVGLFPPTKNLLNYILVFMQEEAKRQDDDDAVQDHVIYCHKMLTRCAIHGARKFSATHLEVEAVLNMGKNESSVEGSFVRISVRWLAQSDVKRHLYIDSQSTALEAVQAMQLSSDLPYHMDLDGNYVPCMGLYQVAEDNGKVALESCLSDSARVLDVISAWIHAIEQAAIADDKLGDHSPELDFSLVFKPRLHFYYLLQPDVLSPTALRIYYYQAVENIIRGDYPLKGRAQAIRFAALQIQASYGAADHSPEIMEALECYLPAAHLNEMLAEASAQGASQGVGARFQVLAIILKQRHLVMDQHPEEARHNYLAEVQQLPHYGLYTVDVSFFGDAKVGDWDFEKNRFKNERENSNKLKMELLWKLGVSEKGILFLTRDTRALKKHEKLCNVGDCGYSPGFFWFTKGDPTLPVTSKASQRVLLFRTDFGKELSQIVKTYQTTIHNKCAFALA